MAPHSPHTRHDLLVEAGRHFVSAALPQARMRLLPLAVAAEDSPAASAGHGRLGEKEENSSISQSVRRLFVGSFNINKGLCLWPKEPEGNVPTDLGRQGLHTGI